jgi:two-component system sensor histidine kinase KdpD
LVTKNVKPWRRPNHEQAIIVAVKVVRWLLGPVLVVAVAAVLLPVRGSTSEATPALLLVVPVVAAGIVAGPVAAVVTAVVATLAFNLAFIQPYWTVKIAAVDDAVALAVFVLVALTVGTLVATEIERRRAAEQRRAEVEVLYGRLEELVHEREQLAEEATRLQVLERVDETRAALLRSVSHDLRTPLATIRAVASDLRDGTVYDDQTRTELLDTVCGEAERLDRLVSNLLSMSRIEAGALRPERQAVDIGELITDRARRLRRLFVSARLQFDVEPGLPLVSGDYTQLDQVLTNLLENAARYAPPGSTVRVTARSVAGGVEVRVADEGIGVPEFEAARIFQPFRRGEGSTSSGLGLAISQAIVDAHGGHIRVERTPGGGATFVFDLPALPAPVPERP